MKVTKVKGHATDEMIDEGKVRKQDKEGNDQADEAADKGSKGDQKYLAAAAKLFCERHKAYKNLVGRFQASIMNMKKEETKLREEIASRRTPSRIRRKTRSP